MEATSEEPRERGTKGRNGVKMLLRFVSRAAQEEEGITGLETAIILITFVVIATVFAFVILTTS